MFGGTNSIQAKIGKESLVLFAKTWVTSYNITLSLNMREGMTHRWIKGPLELIIRFYNQEFYKSIDTS